MENTKQKASAKQKLTIAAIFGAMGPGLLAALSGNDAGGIATYSSAGASYGYKMLWMLPVMTVLLIVTQETPPSASKYITNSSSVISGLKFKSIMNT